MRRTWILVAAIVGLATLGALSWLRSFPLELGLMSAVGMSALVFATLQTVQRLRDQAERDRQNRDRQNRGAPGGDGGSPGSSESER